MKKLLGFGALAMWALMGLAGPTNAAIEESRVAIVSPSNGDDVYETFDLKYEMLDGLHNSKADVYLDGTKQYNFDGTFKSVPKGQHWITVMPRGGAKKADKDTITVEVK
jgi:hypothetical protein